MIVTAEGLADPNADTYKRDKGILVDDLRRDAKRQAIEKAVGAFVDSSTLVENYVTVEDRILSKSSGLIKHIIKESNPWLGDDGFYHMLIKAEVYVGKVSEAVKEMSRTSRISYLKQYGNPKISVAVTARDAERGTKETRSDVAENILKEHISRFGYRVWSEDYSKRLKTEMIERATIDNQTESTVSVSHLKSSDFSIYGKAKFDKRSITLRASGITVTKYVLTSWTVKCINNHTGEEVYFNNKVPKRKSWSSEDAALEDIGRMIGKEFSKEFFEEQLMAPSRIYQLQVLGLPDYDTGVLLKKELIGLRPVLNVDFRSFDGNGLSIYEMDFTGSRNNFNSIINSAVVKPLNAKFKEKAFRFMSAQGEVVKISFQSDESPEELVKRFTQSPPASLASASPERLRQIIKDEKTLEKVAQLNPKAVSKLQDSSTGAGKTYNSVKDF